MINIWWCNYDFVNVNTFVAYFFRRNRFCSASASAYCYTFLCSVVCLSVVCHIRAPCLNRSTDLDAIWQVHLLGPMTHCVRWESLTPPAEGEIWRSNPQPKHAIPNCSQTDSPMLPPGEYKRWVVCTCHSDSGFYQITLVLVPLLVYCVWLCRRWRQNWICMSLRWLNTSTRSSVCHVTFRRQRRNISRRERKNSRPSNHSHFNTDIYTRISPMNSIHFYSCLDRPMFMVILMLCTL